MAIESMERPSVARSDASTARKLATPDAYREALYEAAIACLPRRNYRVALEAGGIGGALTLATRRRADYVLGCHPDPLVAAALRREHCAVPGVAFQARRLPQRWPAWTIDLLVLSEVLETLSPALVDACASALVRTLERGGHALFLSRRGRLDRPLDGDRAIGRLLRHLENADRPFVPVLAHRLGEHRIDVVERV